MQDPELGSEYRAYRHRVPYSRLFHTSGDNPQRMLDTSWIECVHLVLTRAGFWRTQNLLGSLSGLFNYSELGPTLLLPCPYPENARTAIEVDGLPMPLLL